MQQKTYFSTTAVYKRRLRYIRAVRMTEEVPQLRAVYVRRSIYYKSFVAEAVPTTIAVQQKKYFPK